MDNTNQQAAIDSSTLRYQRKYKLNAKYTLQLAYLPIQVSRSSEVAILLSALFIDSMGCQLSENSWSLNCGAFRSVLINNFASEPIASAKRKSNLNRRLDHPYCKVHSIPLELLSVSGLRCASYYL